METVCDLHRGGSPGAGAFGEEGVGFGPGVGESSQSVCPVAEQVQSTLGDGGSASHKQDEAWVPIAGTRAIGRSGFVGASEGLGYLVDLYNHQLRIDRVFAVITILAAIGAGGYFLLEWLDEKLIFWRNEDGR